MSIECSSTVSPTTQIALNAPAPVAAGSKVYDMLEGFALAHKILAQTHPFEPHDFQVEGICAVLDSCDNNGDRQWKNRVFHHVNACDAHYF
jgi:hypothetical protein